ncbi:oligosaccharide flippase family protein [Xenorhabdus sp. ZM]|uniref:oligosaccharide flippase family protein n=1 Tax=Xenorhabdus szentirmaii TaxID=290112 RepID=UPI0019BAC233|nr:oligosaccharide flippase family protein [Xenorhabdus sp. ZM]MBD2804161.1 oligosaccharide flippase family protein [Xenorhabdus sp. ZM]
MSYSGLMNLLSKKVIPPIAEQFLGPIILFLLTPIIINKLGLEDYGLWVLLLSLSMFSQIACLGVTAWLAKIIAESRSISDFHNINRIMSSSFLLILLCIFIITIIIIMVSLLGVFNNISITFVIFCIIACLFQEIDNLFTNATKGYELFHYAFFMELVGRCLWIGVVFLGIIHHEIVAYTCIGIVIKSLIKYFSFNVLVIKKWILPISSINEVKKRFTESKWMFLQLLGGTSLNLFDRLLIPVVLGINKLAAYTPCIQLAQLAFSVPAAANQILMPMFSRFKSTNNYPIYWSKLVLLASLFSTVPCVLLFIFSQEILSLWINDLFSEQNYYILRILALAYGILSLLSTLHFILLGIGESKLVAKINLFAGGITMLATLLVSHFGIVYIACTKFIYPIMQLKYLSLIKKQIVPVANNE